MSPAIVMRRTRKTSIFPQCNNARKKFSRNRNKIGTQLHQEEAVVQESGVLPGRLDVAYTYSVGDELGSGSFCKVVELLRQKNSISSALIHEEIENGSKKKKKVYLAMKQPREDLSADGKLEAEICLRNEAQILSSIQHPHIIKIVCNINPNVGPRNSIVLEKLEGTLQDWNKSRIHAVSFAGLAVKRHTFSTTRRLWNKRIQILSDVADAMKYLHSQNILHRDLKPENCGLDRNGIVKLIDFGLSVRTSEAEEKFGLDSYIFTTRSGTHRYMAPEALQDEPYGKSSDVYSYAMVVWETMSTQRPFANCTSLSEHRRSVGRGIRPKLQKKWPEQLKTLITRSWSSSPHARPSFEQIQKQFDVLQ